MSTSHIVKVLNRLDDPEYSYGRMQGRVVSIDCTESVYVGNSFGTIKSVYRAVRLNNGQTQTLVIFNSEVSLPIGVGDELWAVGVCEGAGRFLAMAVVVPSLQIYADLTKENHYLKTELKVLISSILMTAVGAVLVPNLIGTILFPAGLSLFTIVLYCMCGGSGSVSRRVSTGEWNFIERTISRADSIVE